MAFTSVYLPNSIFFSYTSIALQQDSPHTASISRYVRLTFDMGLSAKFSTDHLPSHATSGPGPAVAASSLQALTLSHLRASIVFLVAGIVASCACFVTETAWVAKRRDGRRKADSGKGLQLLGSSHIWQQI